MVRRLRWFGVFALSLVSLIPLAGCGDNPVEVSNEEPDFITSLSITPNPYGYAPLTAEVTLTTGRPVQVELVVAGRDDAAGDVRHRFENEIQQATFPVLGLYPSFTNTITLRFFDPGGAPLGDVSRSITTQPLLSDLPDVSVDAATPGAMKSGMNLVSYFGHNSELTPQRPFMFDATGAIRWYLDFTQHPSLSNLFYDDGVERLMNGNLYFGDVDWMTAGDGTDLGTRLLQPLDADGQPITDTAVLEGTANHPDFEWAWYQHAPELLPDGTLMLFDNGDNRNYTEQELYSRAVLYRIDADAMTVQQIWQYGKERGSDTFSRIVSDVDYHAAEDNVVFMPGAVRSGTGAYGKVVEVDRATRDVVFEATITAPIAPFGITFHRVERLPLYSPNSASQ